MLLHYFFRAFAHGQVEGGSSAKKIGLTEDVSMKPQGTAFGEANTSDLGVFNL
jgi:hypothetical protein